MERQKEEIHHLFIDSATGLSKELADAIKRVGPIKLQADDSQPLSHHLCRSITNQQLSVKAAATIWGRVLEASDGLPLTDFFNEANAGLMHTCGLSKAKVRAICGIAEKCRMGELEAADFKALNHRARSGRLTTLWGVGQWTADMISIFYFGDEDVWPDGDLAARKTLEQLTSRRRKTIRTAEHFAPYRSYLALYMWKYLDAVPG